MSKTPKRSAGLLMYRRGREGTEVFLVHPGGPFFSKQDQGSWTLPKGEYEGDEEPLAAAIREFGEETGFEVAGPFLELDTVQQKNRKIVIAWAFEGDCDPELLVSNTCEIIWPPRSGKTMVIPEIDRGAWFTLERAAEFVREEQRTFLTRLEQALPE